MRASNRHLGPVEWGHATIYIQIHNPFLPLMEERTGRGASGNQARASLFILMIDDINTSNTELWKYVDDTTIAECVDKKEDSRIQSDVEELIAKSNQNKFQLNESKCKELRISFAKSAADFAPIVINGKAIEVVSTVKLLGLNISSDLRWNCHVAHYIKPTWRRSLDAGSLSQPSFLILSLVTQTINCMSSCHLEWRDSYDFEIHHREEVSFSGVLVKT